ncbi:uroporphyrinogen-III synthase [Sphingomonas glaciei]|uniref:Uroporphyrinogen-III synthase n=1 Tax=Sphingomonas glaciei TaxID=2938948 RepID=A0ABY5MRY8_9SPHN|nr:uroporphyrinogen-III synthase [Sphingomonas glaciei]UUR07250.1 uroporphyrinogen-III synthase [Sphingomonas glaciei]
MRPLVVLRPEPGASATAARAAALGFEVRRHPLFAAEPVPWMLPAGPFDALLVTSANAVRHGGSLPALPVHAVGAASAAAARAAGLEVLTVGERGVDGLLERLPEGLRLLHLAGEERIEPVGARQSITSVAVYRMAPLTLPEASLIEDTVAVVHSPAAGRRLSEVDVARERVRVAAISLAAAAACGSGWARCEAVDAPNDPALLSLAAKLCKEQGR